MADMIIKPSTGNDLVIQSGDNSTAITVGNTGTTTFPSLILAPSTVPTSPAPVEGQIYYNNADNAVYVYNGSNWHPLTNLATGGEITTYTGYRVHTFLASGTFIPYVAGTVDYLVVGGGGGGGGYGGGGGAGGFRTGTNFSVTVSDYPIVVGAGGSGAPNTSTRGALGGDSSFSTITSNGGGGGGTSNINGLGGGSGGGSGYNGSSGVAIVTDPVQGFAGGTGGNGDPYPSGGGGGASASGGVYSGTTAGPGGAEQQMLIELVLILLMLVAVVVELLQVVAMRHQGCQVMVVLVEVVWEEKV